MLEAFEKVSEQVNEWQAVAESPQNTVAQFEEALSSMSGTIEDGVWHIDEELAEVDHVRVEQSVGEIESAILSGGHGAPPFRVQLIARSEVGHPGTS